VTWSGNIYRDADNPRFKATRQMLSALRFPHDRVSSILFFVWPLFKILFILVEQFATTVAEMLTVADS
jgi:hypothetical protein